MPAAAASPPQMLLFDEPVAASAKPGIGEVPVPVSRHPLAEREIRLAGHLIAYALKRVRRRSIGFIVSAEGLAVNAPKWVGIADIEAALQAKAGWICAKLAEQRERASRLQANRVEWRDGAAIPFLGAPLVIVLDPAATGAVLGDGELRIGLPPQAAPAQIRDAVHSWLQRQARRVFEERCGHFAARLGVHCRQISLSSAQTRWGSASANGSIRLNWRLIHFTPACIDYVVAHELAHLREMNHSPRFWDVVRSVIPDVEAARVSLKGTVLPLLD